MTRSDDAAPWTVHDIVKRLEKVYDGAMADRHWSAAVSATMGQARVLGLIVDKRQHAIRPLELWTEAEIIALLGRITLRCAGTDGRRRL